MRALFPIALALLLSGCSWIEYFAVFNASDQPVTVTYSVKKLTTGTFAIFYPNYELYGINKSGHIDWDRKLRKGTGNELEVSVKIPARSALFFGHLNNDNYKKRDQYFINGREFNFGKMQIEKEGATTTITLESFDRYFKKNGGYIHYMIK